MAAKKKCLGICAGVEYTPTKMPKRFSVNEENERGALNPYFSDVRGNSFGDFSWLVNDRE